MFEYIVRDIQAVFKYLPYGILAAFIAFIFLSIADRGRKKRGKNGFNVFSGTVFFMYIVIMLFITFLSRESGSRVGIDLKLFSTWGHNARNHAFVIENVLLFIPYGLLGAIALNSATSLIPCMLLGMFTSMEIEVMQLVTGRGYFQIDDIITNTLGAVIGYAVFRLFSNRRLKDANRFEIVFEIPLVLLLIAVMLYMIAVTGICPDDIEYSLIGILQAKR